MMRIALLLAFLLQFSISYSQVTINIANVTGSTGGTVDVEFRVDNFNDVYGMQFSVRFDPAVITYNQAVNLNNALPGFDPSGSFGTSSVSEGALRVQWNPSSDVGITLPDNSLLFTLRFNVVGAEGTSSEVFISNTPIAIEFLDADLIPYDFAQTRGSVTVIEGGTANVRLTASTETASTNSIVCVKISADGFNGIAAMQFTLNWDPSFMTFNSIGPNNNNINIGAGNLAINNTAGTLGLSYNSVPSQTHPNGTILFEVCFLVTATSGSTNVNFTGNPTPIELADEDGVPINTITQNGSVTLGGIAPDCDPEGFTFAIEHLTVQENELFCLNVRVFDFINIAGLQMTFQWDPTELRYLEPAGYLNGIGLGSGNFGDAMSDMGFLSMVWSSPSGATTIVDGTSMFQICFEAIGDEGTMAMVMINGEKVDLEVIDEDGNNITLFECPGKVTISNVLPFSVSLAGTNPTCSNSTDGAILPPLRAELPILLMPGHLPLHPVQIHPICPRGIILSLLQI